MSGSRVTSVHTSTGSRGQRLRVGIVRRGIIRGNPRRFLPRIVRGARRLGCSRLSGLRRGRRGVARTRFGRPVRCRYPLGHGRFGGDEDTSVPAAAVAAERVPCHDAAGDQDRCGRDTHHRLADTACPGPCSGPLGDIGDRRRGDRGFRLPADGFAEGGTKCLVGPGLRIAVAVLVHLSNTSRSHLSITARRSARPRDTRLLTVPGRTPMVSAISRSDMPP